MIEAVNMDSWNKIPGMDTIQKTAAALRANNIEAVVVENSQQAKEKVLALIPPGVPVMTMTSVTLDSVGLTEEINESGRYDSVRRKLTEMGDKAREKKMLGSSPEWVVGSIHAVTEDGHVLIASNSGSQLPSYAYGADHVVWVVGAQKIVKDFDQGLKRLYEHSLPLESERAKKAYNVPGSFISKLLVVNKEVVPGRITMVIVKEVLGF